MFRWLLNEYSRRTHVILELRFVKEIKKYELDSLSDERIQGYLDMYKLNIESFTENYIEDIYHL